MWQRIQSLYLFIAICLNGLVFIFDLAQFKFNDLDYRSTLYGLVDMSTGLATSTTFILPILCSISLLLSLIVIFIFKKRQIQIKLSQLNLFVQVGFVAAIFFFVDSDIVSFTNDVGTLVEYRAASFISVIPLIFIYLALRSIKKDEALVRAADRIR